MKKIIIMVLVGLFLTSCAAAPTILEVRGEGGEKEDIVVIGEYEDIARCIRDAFISRTMLYGSGRPNVNVSVFPESGLAEVIPTISNGAIEAIYEVRRTETMNRSAVTVYTAKSHGSVILLNPPPMEHYTNIATECGQ